MLGYKAYLDDLCPGCGWPRTYSMHAQAKGHFHAGNALRCHGCTAKHDAEDAAHKANNLRRGAYYVARPDDGMLHAMTDPVLSLEDDDTRWVTGASGVVYPPARDPDGEAHDTP